MLEVIGAGLGRTGTHSLADALEIIGFGPCYTILDVDKSPSHLDFWNDALIGKEMHWQSVYQGYRSAVEWPTVSFLPSILQQYPASKVILTMRDADSWYESASTTIFPGLELSAHHPDPKQRSRSEMKRNLILQGMFGGKYWDRDYAISVYQKHFDSVFELVPDHGLLQYRIGDGWGPLCKFLDVAVPSRPFPHHNKRSEFLNSAPTWARDYMDRFLDKNEDEVGSKLHYR